MPGVFINQDSHFRYSFVRVGSGTSLNNKIKDNVIRVVNNINQIYFGFSNKDDNSA